jgi:hypothetical protein
MPVDGRSIPARPRTCRSKVTNRPSKMVIDGRSLLGRRVRDMADYYVAQLGGCWATLTDMQAAAVRRAAELTALAEQARADALKNGNADPEQLVRLENLATRAERRLSFKPRAENRPTLREHLQRPAGGGA